MPSINSVVWKLNASSIVVESLSSEQCESIPQKSSQKNSSIRRNPQTSEQRCDEAVEKRHYRRTSVILLIMAYPSLIFCAFEALGLNFLLKGNQRDFTFPSSGKER